MDVKVDARILAHAGEAGDLLRATARRLTADQGFSLNVAARASGQGRLAARRAGA